VRHAGEQADNPITNYRPLAGTRELIVSYLNRSIWQRMYQTDQVAPDAASSAGFAE
jgi:hypothetical protein